VRDEALHLPGFLFFLVLVVVFVPVFVVVVLIDVVFVVVVIEVVVRILRQHGRLDLSYETGSVAGFGLGGAGGGYVVQK
jgi:hypothetical protein